MDHKFKLQNSNSESRHQHSRNQQGREADSLDVAGSSILANREAQNSEAPDLEAEGRLASSIHDFRSALAYLAARQPAPSAVAAWLDPARRRARTRQRRRIAAFAFTVLAAVALLPLSLQHRAAPAQTAAVQSGVQSAATPNAQPGDTSNASSDNALLDHVDTEVSESVPSALAPLAELENISSASSTQSDINQMEGTNAPQIR